MIKRCAPDPIIYSRGGYAEVAKRIFEKGINYYSSMVVMRTRIGAWPTLTSMHTSIGEVKMSTPHYDRLCRKDSFTLFLLIKERLIFNEAYSLSVYVPLVDIILLTSICSQFVAARFSLPKYVSHSKHTTLPSLVLVYWGGR